MAVSRAEQKQMLDSEETGLQEHNDNNCLYCAGLTVLGFNSQHSTPGEIRFVVKLIAANELFNELLYVTCQVCCNLLSSSSSSSDLEVPPFSEWCSSPPANHVEVVVQAKLSGASGCSDTVSQGSGGSGRSTELVLGEF